MRDVELYQQILGLSSPWTVERVELDVEAQRVGVCVCVEHGAEARGLSHVLWALELGLCGFGELGW